MSKIWGITLLFILITSCGEPIKEDKEFAITIWESFKYQEHELFVELLNEFSKEYFKETGKKLIIRAHRVPFDDFETNIKLAALGGKTPDVACFDALKVIEFAYHKVLVPIDTLENFKKDTDSIATKAKQYMPGAFNTNVIDIQNARHLYGLPMQTTCLALFWNRKLFREKAKELEAANLDPNSPPTTWDEFIKYSQALTDKENKQYGFAMNNSLWFTLPFFGCYNAVYLKKDAEGKMICTLDNKLACEALQLKVDLTQKYGVEPGAWKPGDLGPDVRFENEKCAMILTGPWNVEKYRNMGLDFGITKIPKISHKEAIRVGLLEEDSNDKEYQEKITSATNVGGVNIAIFKSCRYPEAAYKLINFLTSEKAQMKWCQKLGQIPTNQKAANRLIGDDQTDKYIKIFLDQARYSTSPPSIPRYGFLEADIVNPQMEQALKKEKTVYKALHDATKEINEKILAPLYK